MNTHSKKVLLTKNTRCYNIHMTSILQHTGGRHGGSPPKKPQPQQKIIIIQFLKFHFLII